MASRATSFRLRGVAAETVLSDDHAPSVARQADTSEGSAMTSLSFARRHDVFRSIGIAWSLCLKSFETRYARSALGLLWLVLTPIATLALYWSVFGLVLGVKWPAQPGGDEAGYIVPFMAGLAIFLFFGEMVSRSLAVFVSRRNYVRKSPVPLWVLWLADFMGAGIIGAINLALLIALALIYGRLTLNGFVWTLPVILFIVVFFAGISLILSLIGPFWGDVANSVPVVLRFMFYTAPITFPLSQVPEKVQHILWLNPLTALVEMLRGSVVFDTAPSPFLLVALAAIALTAITLAAWLYSRVADAVRDVV